MRRSALPCFEIFTLCACSTHTSPPTPAQCPAIADGIKACQARGKKVILSLGGAAGLYGFASDAEAAGFAKILWQMFLGGTAPGWLTW